MKLNRCGIKTKINLCSCGSTWYNEEKHNLKSIYLKQISGFLSLTEIQKIVLTSEAHLLRKALSI